ncbi:MAG TPA: 2-C-methyl-D-erythritol 4-phosphate cytidylyltransferase [Acidimicrobiia bacterium]|nr:2-C-methyl-D-erythritol 4-phosphate cytidylyltransferase [Acidimicrobiia bacterium]
MTVWGIVVAGGQGTRFGSPKQFERLGDGRVVDRAVLTAVAACDHVAVVLPPDMWWDGDDGAVAVAGGERRSDSVRAGLAAVGEDAGIVVVHDAARPLASKSLFDAVIGAVRAGADAAVPGLPVPDTLKRVDGTRVVETVTRQGLFAVQTPQAFRAAALRRAHAGEPDATDDAALVEAAGGTVVVVPGDPRNLKVTAPGDLAMAEALSRSAP